MTAKKALQRSQATSQNRLHVAAKLAANDLQVYNERLIALVCRPYYSEFNVMCDKLKGPKETLAFFAARAKGSWMKPIVESLDVCRDVLQLKRCGFDVDFDSNTKANARDEGYLASQDSFAFTLGSLVQSFMVQHVGSRMWHDYYPGKLAGILE